MKILWFTWKDRQHPDSGGAEVVNEELAKRLVQAGHEVIFIVSGFANSQPKEEIDGYQIIRVGSRWTVYFRAWRYYKRHLQGWADLVIDEVNTMPFFSKLYVKEPNILFVHQLCRQIWFYQMFFPLNILGYLLEPLYLRLLSDQKVITVSQSTKLDLTNYGFSPKNIAVISQGITMTPISNLEDISKYNTPTLLSLGSLRPMKRTLDIIEAFEMCKPENPTLKLIVAGSSPGSYAKKVLKKIQNSPYQQDITYLGEVSFSKKKELMRSSHLILVASVKEGWGLIVTEAASQGTPAVVYNVDGLRDSVKHSITGLVCKSNKPGQMALQISWIIGEPRYYRRFQQAGWQWSKTINFQKSCQDFLQALDNFDTKG